MHEGAPLLVDAADRLTVGRRRWIDVLLALTGIAVAAAGWPAAGVPLVSLALVVPLLHRLGRRGEGTAVAHLVPPELAAAHAAVRRAAALPGVPGSSSAVIDAVDDTVLEVAALLRGRLPRGAAQERFVAARVAAMDRATEELQQWHEAWLVARDEVEAISPSPAPAEAAPPARGNRALVGAFLVLLFPLFAMWDVAVGAGRGVIALVDGIAFRVRTALRLIVQVAARVTVIGSVARGAWNDARAAFVIAASDARAAVVSARLEVRLRLRRARRAAG